MNSEAIGAESVKGGPTRTIALIVNPAAGGGRAGRMLGAVGDALSSRGLAHHIERTRSLAHAGERSADTEETCGSGNFRDNCGSVDRWSSCAN